MINLDINKIVDSGILTRIRPRKRRWIMLMFAVFAIGTTGWAFRDGNQLGYRAGWQDAAIAVKQYLITHQRATIFEDPGHQVLAMVQNGVCFPFPSRIPELHHTVWVSVQWLPCSARTIAPYIHPVRVMEALK